MNLKIKRAQSDCADFRNLTKLLDADLNKRYNKEQAKYDQYNKIDWIETVVIAYGNDKPIGCGCFKVFNSQTIEIKRMFVRVDYRGKGISKIILGELEKWATELGYGKSVLETGKGQPEAIGLYQNFDYSIIPNFGQYAEMPNSVCFEKKLL